MARYGHITVIYQYLSFRIRVYLLFDAEHTFISPPNLKLNNPTDINIEKALTLDHGQHVEKKGKRKSKK